MLHSKSATKTVYMFKLVGACVVYTVYDLSGSKNMSNVQQRFMAVHKQIVDDMYRDTLHFFGGSQMWLDPANATTVVSVQWMTSYKR